MYILGAFGPLICYSAVLLQLHASTATSGSFLNNTAEEVLDQLLRSSNYSKNTRPGLAEGVPTKVNVSMAIVSITNLNSKTMDFKLSVFFRQRWKDSRLNFAHTGIQPHAVLMEDQWPLLWVPDLYFLSEKKATLHIITVPNKMYWIYPDGTVLYSQRISMTVSCHMDLAAFPFDNQTCPVIIESYAYDTRDILMAWHHETPVEMVRKIKTLDFDITGHTFEAGNSTYITGAFPRCSISFMFKRRLAYWLSNSFFPNIMVVILSWISFWIDSDSVPARVSVGLLPILTVSTQTSGVVDRFPQVAYIKAMDIWNATCFVFVFGSFIEYAIVNVLDRIDKKQLERESQKEKNTMSARLSGDVSLGEVTEVQVMRNNFISMEKSCLKKDSMAQSSCYSFPETSKPVKKQNRGKTLDKLSRWLFPISFLVFNMGFWIYYTQGKE